MVFGFGSDAFLFAVDEFEDFAGEEVLCFSFAGVGAVLDEDFGDFRDREEGEEFEVALDVGVGGAQEKLSKGVSVIRCTCAREGGLVRTP